MIKDKQKILGAVDLIHQAFAVYRRNGDSDLANHRLRDAHAMIKEIISEEEITAIDFDELLSEYCEIKNINENTKDSIGELFTGFVMSFLDDTIEGCIVCFG